MSNIVKFPPSVGGIDFYTENEFIGELNGAGFDDSEFQVSLSRMTEDNFGDKGGWVILFYQSEEGSVCGVSHDSGEVGVLKEYRIQDAVKLLENSVGFDDVSFSVRSTLIE